MSLFHFNPTTFSQHNNNDDVQEVPESFSRRSIAQSVVNKPINIATDDSEAPSGDDQSKEASGEESNPEPHGRRGKPVAVQKRGGARCPSPKQNAYDVLRKGMHSSIDKQLVSDLSLGKGKASSPGARRCSSRAAKPSEKGRFNLLLCYRQFSNYKVARQPSPTGSPEPAPTRKKKTSPARKSQAKKKAKTSIHTVNPSSLPKAANIADSTNEEEGRTDLCYTKSVFETKLQPNKELAPSLVAPPSLGSMNRPLVWFIAIPMPVSRFRTTRSDAISVVGGSIAIAPLRTGHRDVGYIPMLINASESKQSRRLWHPRIWMARAKVFNKRNKSGRRHSPVCSPSWLIEGRRSMQQYH